MKNNNGFSATELTIVLAILVVTVGVGGGTAYVVFHFVSKFW